MKKFHLFIVVAGLAAPALAQQSSEAMKDPMQRGMRGGWMEMGPVTRTEAELRGKAMFARLDANRDGFLIKEELTANQPRMGMGRPDHAGAHAGPPPGGGRFADMQFANMDANKDGKVSEAEFVAHHLARFDMADANHDGTVTPEERKSAMGAMGEKIKAQYDLKANKK